MKIYGFRFTIKSFFLTTISKVGYALALGASKVPKTVFSELLSRSIDQTVDFIQENMGNALVFSSHSELLDFALRESRVPGSVLEFGVFRGKTINYLAQRLNNVYHSEIVWGFDSFEGLPDDWGGYTITKDTFNQNGLLPRVRKNVKLVKGYFDQSLPEWVTRNHINAVSLLHVDSDLYESAMDIFRNLDKYIVDGTIIVFDEYFAYQDGSIIYKALTEFASLKGFTYEYLALFEQKVVVRIVRATK